MFDSFISADLSADAIWLPIFFLLAMGISILLYVILDGYDLGVGMLINGQSDANKDMMIASIGPFWDANETWLVLGVGILLIAFPMAHGFIFQELYLPVAFMIMSLILRGVSFDFRAKVNIEQKPLWNLLFFLGSLGTTLCQGFMIARVITGFDHSLNGWIFSVLVALCLPFAYCLLGATWLILKTDGPLQILAIKWAHKSLFLTAVCVGLISIATPYFIPSIFEKWFTGNALLHLAPIPVLTLLFFYQIYKRIRHIEAGHFDKEWLPFVYAVGIFTLSFLGIAYSMFPDLIVNQMNIWEASSATESLWMIFWGTVIVLPAILLYTIFTYMIFWGKSEPLKYY